MKGKESGRFKRKISQEGKSISDGSQWIITSREKQPNERSVQDGRSISDGGQYIIYQKGHSGVKRLLSMQINVTSLTSRHTRHHHQSSSCAIVPRQLSIASEHYIKVLSLKKKKKITRENNHANKQKQPNIKTYQTPISTRQPLIAS